MRVEFTVLKRQYEKYQIEYEEAALRALRSGWYTLGKELEEFEAAFAAFLGVKHCVGLNSGLDALYFALRALEIGHGDEVIVPSNTFIATALAITENGAIPVFVDPDEYFNIDTNKIEAAITSRTKAIMAVHLFGQPCSIDKIKRIADRFSLLIIEDCAQAHGSSLGGQLIGTFGDVACFSFYPTKPMGAFGDAGAIATNNPKIEERIIMLRNYGSRIKYVHEITGLNSRLDEIQAALLQVNLKHVFDGNAERRDIARKYHEGIKNTQIIMPKEMPGAEHVYHIFAIRYAQRDELLKFLAENNVYAQVHYPIPCHLAECYSNLGYKVGDFPIAEKFANEELSLPIYVGMPEDEINYVIDVINNFRG